jgi:hypothetical protein
MANHVHYSVNFHQINEQARAKLQELFSRVRTDGNYQWFSDIFVDGDELTYEQTEQYSWTLENIGPKWCYFEDYSAAEGDVYFNGEAAWSAPEEGLVKLLEILEEHDPNIITSMTYEDEMPNFVGVYVYQGSECYDGFEDEWEELRDRVIAESETLTPESWDEEEDDWADDEARDTFQEEMWEIIGDSQWQIIHECVEQLKEDQKEQ